VDMSGRAAAAGGVPGGGGAADLGGKDEAAGSRSGDMLDAIPGAPAPASHAAEKAPVSEFMRVLMATGRAKDAFEHAALRNDLCERVWKERGRLLLPYLG